MGAMAGVGVIYREGSEGCLGGGTVMLRPTCEIKGPI